jgi:acyl-CoA synthetase (AMP-forming)/AMP-acid ligase II
MITHGNLLSNQRAIKSGFGHTEKTIFAGWLPLFHDMGLIGNVLQPLYLGIPSVLMSPVAFLQKPFNWLQAISRYKATTSGGPNFAYDLCVRKITPGQRSSLDLSSWEVAFNGAEPVQAETMESFASYFAPCGFRREAFYPCYGMAEATLFISGGLKTVAPIVYRVEGAALEENRVVAAEVEEETRTIVGCGRTWLDEKIAIVDPKSLTQCPAGKVGEIWVSGSSVARGYWNRLEQTAETFQAELALATLGASGPFLRTGDLGFLQDGELFVTGRLKDVIIIRGQNHYPQDIELTVQKSHLGLRSHCGAAFTVEQNGQQRLVIVQEVERTYLRRLDIQEVVGNITEAVINNHGLQVYSTVLIRPGSIPKTSSGKIQRHACKRGFLDGNLNVVAHCSGPQHQALFQKLEADVTSLLVKVQRDHHDSQRTNVQEDAKTNAIQ